MEEVEICLNCPYPDCIDNCDLLKKNSDNVKKEIAERSKKYYLKNKKKILEIRKNYYEKHKDQIKANAKEKYLKNREEILERNKKYRKMLKNKKNN